jgi:hypothetical protein
LRKVEIRGFVIYDPDEVSHGSNGEGVCASIEHLLFNEDYPQEWSFESVSDVEINEEEADASREVSTQ